MEYFLHGVRLWQRGRVLNGGRGERLSAVREYDSTGGNAGRAVRIALVDGTKALEKHLRESDGNGRCGRISTAPGGYAARSVDCGVVNEPISVEKIA